MGKVGRIFGVVNGKPDQGKSYFVKNYMIPKLKQDRPVVILDIIGEYEGRIFKNFREFYGACKKAGRIPEGVNVVRWDSQETAINLIKYLRFMERPVAVILEEAHILFNDSDLQKGIRQALPELTFLGAHHGFSVILCSQRPKSLPTNVRSAADFFVSFKQDLPADLNYLREYHSSPENVKEVVASLKQKQFFSIGSKPKGYDEIKINEVNQL